MSARSVAATATPFSARRRMATGYPALSERAQGWLRFLHRKAFAPDDWGQGGIPSPLWDDRSTPPMLCFPRFDLIDSSYALALALDRTPAWTEMYAGLLERLIERYISYWGAIDWLTQIGPDPRRAHYPTAWLALIPRKHVGEYDIPGWTANGIEPWGLQMDPVGATGNLFYKGFLDLLLGFYALVAGDDRFNEPFEVVGNREHSYWYTHHEVNALLERQWAERPEGCHCENTKIWPYCLTAAALGLRLHDLVYDTRSHRVFDSWWEHAKREYLSIPESGDPEWVSLYYDPIIDHLHRSKRGGHEAGLALALYLAPQRRDEAHRIFRWAAREFGWDDPDKPTRSQASDPRFLCMGVALANELGERDTYAQLREHVEREYQPTWDRDRLEFGYHFGLDESVPRGQPNATLMMAEFGDERAWWRVFNEPRLRRDEPTLRQVDFPRLGITQACWDRERHCLVIATYAATAPDRDERTRFSVVDWTAGADVHVVRDGEPYPFTRDSDGTIVVEAPVGEHVYLVSTGEES